jgi:hypothetical protein
MYCPPRSSIRWPGCCNLNDARTSPYPAQGQPMGTVEFRAQSPRARKVGRMMAYHGCDPVMAVSTHHTVQSANTLPIDGSHGDGRVACIRRTKTLTTTATATAWTTGSSIRGVGRVVGGAGSLRVRRLCAGISGAFPRSVAWSVASSASWRIDFGARAEGCVNTGPTRPVLRYAHFRGATPSLTVSVVAARSSAFDGLERLASIRL